jgi:hypothetical protein
LTENIFGETGQQVTENLLILSLPDSVVRIGCSFILSFSILFGDGWGWRCGGWMDEVIGLSTIDGSSDLGFLGLVILAGEFIGDGDEC